MTNVFVVGTEQNLTDLTGSILKARSSVTTRESAIAALRAANPGLDLDRIRPGTVVLVPPLDGVRVSVAGADPVTDVGTDLVQRVQAAVDGLAGGAEAAEEERQLEKKSVQELLGSSAVKRAAAQSPALAANVESVRATFKQDDAEAKRQLAAVRESAGSWAGDLEALMSLLRS